MDVMVEVVGGGSSATYAPQPQSSTYAVGSIVEYNSKFLGRWIMAKVLECKPGLDPDDCTYVLDCNPGLHVPPGRIRWPASKRPNGNNTLHEPDFANNRNGAQAPARGRQYTAGGNITLQEADFPTNRNGAQASTRFQNFTERSSMFLHGNNTLQQTDFASNNVMNGAQATPRLGGAKYNTVNTNHGPEVYKSFQPEMNTNGPEVQGSLNFNGPEVYKSFQPEINFGCLDRGSEPQLKFKGTVVTGVAYCCPECKEACSTLEEAIAHCSAKVEPVADPTLSDSSPEPQPSFQETVYNIYRCPECHEALSTLEEAVAHCSPKGEPGTDSTRSDSSPELQPSFQETVLYRCPECQEALSTLEEAVAHCSAKREAVHESQQTTGQPGIPAATLPSDGLPEGTTLVECDKNKNAEPVITRQVDEDTGVARTIVREEDGSEKVFGQNTVQSLIKSDDETAEAWVDALTMRQIRGLVHEVGQRLVTHSQSAQGKSKQRSDLQEELNYMALGLSPHVSTKELDAAYKRLAKLMHPDKHGGSQEAKESFQYMKERYEAIRASRKKTGLDKCGNEGEDVEHASNGGTDGEHVEHPFKGAALENSSIPDRKEAYDEDETEEAEEKSEDAGTGVLSYDPSNRESLHHTLWKMLKDLRRLDQQIQSLDADIEYLQKESDINSQTSRFAQKITEGNIACAPSNAACVKRPSVEEEKYDQADAEPVLPPRSFSPGDVSSF